MKPPWHCGSCDSAGGVVFGSGGGGGGGGSGGGGGGEGGVLNYWVWTVVFLRFLLLVSCL